MGKELIEKPLLKESFRVDVFGPNGDLVGTAGPFYEYPDEVRLKDIIDQQSVIHGTVSVEVRKRYSLPL